MNPKTKLAVLFIAPLLAVLLAPPSGAASSCITFEPPLLLGTLYGAPAGQVSGDLAFTSSGVSVYVYKFFLPGGGMDEGETPHETVLRETLEECGLAIRIGSWTTVAIQFAWSEAEQMFFEKRSTFVDASVVGPDTSRIEPDHEVLWVYADRACELLTHESHGWAVRASTFS